MIGPAPAVTSTYPSRTTHLAGVPSCDRHCERFLPSNSTTASEGGATGGRSGPGSTTGGRGRSMEWTGQLWAVIVAGRITPMAVNAERGTRNAEQRVAALFRVPTSAFRVSLTVSRFPSPPPARTARCPPAESRASSPARRSCRPSSGASRPPGRGRLADHGGAVVGLELDHDAREILRWGLGVVHVLPHLLLQALGVRRTAPLEAGDVSGDAGRAHGSARRVGRSQQVPHDQG